MTKILLTLTLGASLLAGCGKDDDACATLDKKIIDGAKVSADKLKPWMDEQMRGPDDKPLDGAQRAGACTMILEDKDALAGFIETARTDLASK